MANSFFDTHGDVLRLVGSEPPDETLYGQSAAQIDVAALRAELNALMDIEFARNRGRFAQLKCMMVFLLAGNAAVLFELFQ